MDTQTQNKPLTGAELDTLVALVERGPLDDGDVPSKSGRNSLLDRGLAVRVVVNGQDGYTAATYDGRDAYTQRYGADTMREAMQNRQDKRNVVAVG